MSTAKALENAEGPREFHFFDIVFSLDAKGKGVYTPNDVSRRHS